MNFRFINFTLLGIILSFQGAIIAQAQQGRGGNNNQGGRGGNNNQQGGYNNMQGGYNNMQGGNMMQQGGYNNQGNYNQGGFNNQGMMGGNMMQQGGFNNNMRTQNNALPTSAPFPYPETEIDVNSDTQGPFYFVDESPIQILKILEILTGKSILQPPNLPNVKVNFTSKNKIATADAILLLESLLSMNGIAIIPTGDVLKAVSISGVNAQSPEFLEGDVLSMPASQKFYSKLYKLNYQDISGAQTLLSSFITPGGIGAFVAFQRSNSFLLTDTLANHQRMQKLLNQIDAPTEINEDMAFIELKNTSASEMETRLKSISGNLLKKYFENTIIESDDRTNQLIVFTRKGNMKYIKEFVKGFDIEAEPLTQSEVFYIKHGTAEDVATAINSIIDGQQDAVKTLTENEAVTKNSTLDLNRSASNLTSIGAESATVSATTTIDSYSPEAGLSAAQQQRQLLFSNYVTITSDERSNSIIANGTKSDIKNIKELIDKIDVVLLQVKIDVIITEVQLTDEQVSGLNSFGLGYDVDMGTVITGVTGFGVSSTGQSLNGTTPSFSLEASENAFQAVFNIASEKSNIRILSAPTIVTAHNKVGMINISTSYPTITSSVSSITNVENSQSTIEYQDVGINLTVTPLIGDNGMVQLELTQTANTLLNETTINGNAQPVIGKREAESFVSVKSGELIILGGMRQISDKDSKSKVWLLGDIPLIGELFSPSTNDDEVSELIMFIRPTIIDSTSVAEALTSEELNTTESGAMIKTYLETGNIPPMSDDEKKAEQTNYRKKYSAGKK